MTQTRFYSINPSGWGGWWVLASKFWDFSSKGVQEEVFGIGGTLSGSEVNNVSLTAI